MGKSGRTTLRDMAMIVPVLLVIVLGGTDLIQSSQAQSTMNQVVQTAAECVSTPGCILQSDTARNAKALGLDPDYLNVNLQGKVVTLAYVFHGSLPLFPTPHFTATATAQ